MKGTAGTGPALDVCLPPTFYLLLLQEQNLDCFILLPEQSDTFLSSVLGLEVTFCFYQLKCRHCDEMELRF